jgi:hypothetical protein
MTPLSRVCTVKNSLHLLSVIQKKTLNLALSHVRLTFQTRLLKSPERSHGITEKPTNNTHTSNGQKERKAE